MASSWEAAVDIIYVPFINSANNRCITDSQYPIRFFQHDKKKRIVQYIDAQIQEHLIPDPDGNV